MIQSPRPHRYLDLSFLNALDALANSSADGSWWRDVLRRDDLVIAVRRNSLNVYFRGASIFRVDWNEREVTPLTHAKYLVRQTQSYVSLAKGQFTFPSDPVWKRYDGERTLQEMMRAAAAFAGSEKSGLHPLLTGDRRVIDVEIALTRAQGDFRDPSQPLPSDADETKRRQDRLDAAVVSQTSNGNPAIVFYEAKHFSNPALRATGETAAAVVNQMEDYRTAIAAYEESLATGYVEVAKALVSIAEMRNAVGNLRAVDPLISQIAAGALPFINPEPRLLIFGFDKAQRDDPAWGKHLRKLEDKLPGRVRAIGNPTRQTVAFR